MNNFNDRPKYTEQECRDALMNPSNAITHLLDNRDGTFSLMYHIVCAWCDYCDEQGDCRGRQDVKAVNAKNNPYENQEKIGAFMEDNGITSISCHSDEKLKWNYDKGGKVVGYSIVKRGNR